MTPLSARQEAQDATIELLARFLCLIVLGWGLGVGVGLTKEDVMDIYFYIAAVVGVIVGLGGLVWWLRDAPGPTDDPAQRIRDVR